MRSCCYAYYEGLAPMCEECANLLASDAFSGVDNRHPEPVGVDPYEARREPQKPSWELER